MDGQRHSDGRSTPTVRRRWRRVTSLMAVMSVIAGVILRNGVDIVGLEEVGPNPPPIGPYDEGSDADRIAAQLTLRDPGNETSPGTVTWHVYRDGTRALLTRDSSAGEGQWRFANENRRGFIRIVATERDFGEQAYIYDTHLSASPPTGGRAEQAQAIVDQIATDRAVAEGAGHVFRAVLLGDLNEDVGDAVTTLTGAGMVSARDALPMPDGGRDGDTFIEADSDGSILRGRVDHVWVGTHGGARDLSIDAGELDTAAGPNWDDATGGYSDHRPLVVQLSIL